MNYQRIEELVVYNHGKSKNQQKKQHDITINRMCLISIQNLLDLIQKKCYHQERNLL